MNKRKDGDEATGLTSAITNNAYDTLKQLKPVSQHPSVDVESSGNFSLNAASNSVQCAIFASLICNILLALGKIYATYTSGSLAVLSSMVDSLLDLTSQALFWYSDKNIHQPDENYPAGRRRLEPVVVIISATLMGMAALEVAQKAVETLIQGLVYDKFPDLNMSREVLILLLVAVGLKLFLWFYCSRVGKSSSSANALAQDHRNDVFSNSVAVITSYIAHRKQDLWYADPIGAIAISIYIAWSWINTGREQVERLVGLQADEEFIQQIRSLADCHHPAMKSDIVRAYHFGNNFLVEIEVILPEKMYVKDAHDISLSLQTQVETLDQVERAFVHVDYLPRDYDEHKDPTIRRESR